MQRLNTLREVAELQRDGARWLHSGVVSLVICCCILEEVMMGGGGAKKHLRVPGKSKHGSRKIPKPNFPGRLDQQYPHLISMVNNPICRCGDDSSSHI